MNKEKNNNSITKRELLIVALIDAIIFGIIIISTGSLFSGFHLVDDHTVLGRINMIDSYSFIDSVKLSQAAEAGQRFRPLYCFLLVVKSITFRDNLNMWMMVDLIEGMITFFLLYLSARFMRTKTHEAFLFAGLILFGEQITPWYRALNQENEGMFILSILLAVLTYGYCCSPSEKPIYNKIWFRICVIILAIILSIQKEAFVLLYPFWPLLTIYLEKEFTKSTWANAVKDNLVFMITFATLFILEIYMIFAYTGGGTNSSYAGFSPEVAIMSYINGIIKSVRKSLKWYLLLLAVAIILIVILYRKSINMKHILLILFGFGVMASQLLLHARSGMWERYLFPFIVGWAMVALVMTFDIIRQGKYTYWIYIAACSILLIIGLGKSYNGAKTWAQSGKGAAQILESISEIEPENTILLKTGWEEWDWAIEKWMEFYKDEYPIFTRDDELADELTDASYDYIIADKKRWKNLSDEVKDKYEEAAVFEIDKKLRIYKRVD